MAQVDLILPRPCFMMGELDRYAEIFKLADSSTAEIHTRAARDLVKIAALINGDRRTGPVILMPEQIEFNFRMAIEAETFPLSIIQRILQDIPGVPEAWLPLRGEDITEHAGCRIFAAGQGKYLESRSIRPHQHIILRYARKPFDC